ncbi:MAG: hypothetical protein ACFFAJ_05775 [Candidatus Hodarchaeota archaeon]
MPEVPIPGMAFRARLSKKGTSNIIELIFRGNSITSNDIQGNLTESSILSALKQGCTEADIDHQVAESTLDKVAQDLYKEAGLGEGKTLVPQEFELGSDSTELDRKLAIIISSLQKVHKRLDKIETMLEFGPQEK